ncbi:MAG TPA: tol-pal system protein YbgF [Gammaproteobacteria bacterium]|nr:tol-pal system protein YbgF [Gammaproteobacteria bacterium]
MSTLRTLLIVAGLGTLLAGCQVRDDDPYAVRQRELEAKVDQLEQVFKNQSLQGMSQRIDGLQDQLEKLRGDVEVLEHNQDLDKKQQRDLYQDLDKRLQKLEMGLSAAPAPASAAPVQAAPVGNGADEGAYQKSFNQLKDGRFSDAIKGFKSFLKQYPDSPLVPNAVFWTGEAYYQMSDFDTALATFKKVVKDYPTSSKVSDALLKVGYCQYEQQQWKSARQTLNSVVQNYPNSSAASLATQRLQRMQDEGH